MQELQAILSRGNKIAKRLSKKLLGPKKGILFRQLLFSENPPTGVSLEVRKAIRQIDPTDLQKIRAVLAVRDEAFAKFEAMQWQFAHRAHRKYPRIPLHDLFIEAGIATNNAIWNYTDLSKCLSTYVYTAILRQLRTFVSFYLTNIRKMGLLETDVSKEDWSPISQRMTRPNREVMYYNGYPAEKVLLAYEAAKLRPLEREVIEAVAKDESLADVARRHGITRMAASQALKKARQKVLDLVS